MRLRRKILVSVVIITALTIFSTSVIAQFLLIDQIGDYEKKTAGQELQGLSWVINEKVRNEEVTAADWSNWDATYNFVQNPNRDYLQSVLVDETFITGNLNIVIYLNETGDIVYERGFDTRQKQDMGIPPEFYRSLTNHGILYNNTEYYESSAGLLVLNDSVMIVSAYTILTSRGEGPVKGILIRAQYIEPGEIARELGSNADSFLIGDEIQYKSNPVYPADNGQIIYYTDQGGFAGETGRIHAVTEIYDFYKDPLPLEITMKRDIYIRGVSTLLFILITIIIIGIISAAVYLIIFRNSVMQQLDSLSKDAGQIAESRDPSRRVRFSGDPEFTHLADSINIMLSSLETATNEKFESERKYRELFSSSLDGIVLTDPEGGIIDANPAFFDISGIDPGSLDGDRRISFFGMLNKECNSDIINTIISEWDSGKKLLKYEAEMTSFAGDQIPVELTPWPLRDESDTVRGIWWLVRDITERKEADNIRREALSRIEDNLERMATLNDEIRNPLSIIVGLSEMKCPEASKEILEQVEKIDRIVNLLDRGWLKSKKVHDFLMKQNITNNDKNEGK